MGVADIEFNQALVDARVIGCAYGFQKVAGLRGPVPCITLIGTNASAFIAAYQCFARWGCEEDGDVVSVDFLLRTDGTYDLWVAPELKRFMFRTIPQYELFDALGFQTSWIKHMDSTQEFLRQELKRYSHFVLHPIFVYAAIGDPRNRLSPDFEMVSEWNPILKFDVRIIDQSDNPSDPRFSLPSRAGARTSDRHVVPSVLAPEDICRKRLTTLDVAFPVSRERVRRSSLLRDVRAISGFEHVAESQVTQAAINLMLSAELVPGDRHYRKVTGKLDESIWHAIGERVELADGKSAPADQSPLDLARQIELDARAVLSSLQPQDSKKSFSEMQALMLRCGYVGD